MKLPSCLQRAALWEGERQTAVTRTRGRTCEGEFALVGKGHRGLLLGGADLGLGLEGGERFLKARMGR